MFINEKYDTKDWDTENDQQPNMGRGGQKNISKNNFYEYKFITKRNVNNCILLNWLKMPLVVTLWKHVKNKN